MYFYSYPIHTTISIRAPARGATAHPTQTEKIVIISIRAPARGATMDFRPILIYFLISIRAPARGATSRRWRQQSSRQNFNPRSREGSDINADNNEEVQGYFNPRSREGSDRDSEQFRRSLTDFNPRSREGSDNGYLKRYVVF